MTRLFRTSVVVLLLALTSPSCRTGVSDDVAQKPASPEAGTQAPSGKFAPDQAVAFRGTLGTGAECPTLTIEGGRLFSLAGDLGRFKPGDQVCVRGTIAAMSICMAGEATISLTSVAAPDSCP